MATNPKIISLGILTLLVFQPLSFVFAQTTTVYPSKYYNIDSNGKVTKHIFANGIEIATIEGTGSEAKVEYLHPDNLGSTNVVTDEKGAMVETTDYYPFGTVRVDKKATSFSEQRKYIGQEYDNDTGLNYLNARYYDSATGKFLSQDPVFWNPEKILQDPQSMNSYAYARNNPIVNIDPDGKLWFLAPTLGGAVVGGIIGGVGSAISGNSFWQGAKYGSISGAVTGFTISTGGIGGATLGLTSSEALIGSSALGNVLGGVAGRASIGQNTTGGDVGLDLSLGGVGGILGSGVISKNARNQLLQSTTDPKLTKIINELYRNKSGVGDGGTADALRYETQTGKLLSDSGHLIKATERITELTRYLGQDSLSAQNKQIGQSLLNNLKDAISKVKK